MKDTKDYVDEIDRLRAQLQAANDSLAERAKEIAVLRAQIRQDAILADQHTARVRAAYSAGIAKW